MALSKDAILKLYRKRAGNYDFTANLYYFIGFREMKYRKMTISQLRLKPGDTAIEIGCGTGLNFKYVQQAVGDTGQIIGVDLTDAMLKQAKSRVVKNEWENIRLVKSDAAEYDFPAGINGVYSTFALTLVPEYQAVIERASDALVDGGRFAIFSGPVLSRLQGYTPWGKSSEIKTRLSLGIPGPESRTWILVPLSC